MTFSPQAFDTTGQIFGGAFSSSLPAFTVPSNAFGSAGAPLSNSFGVKGMGAFGDGFSVSDTLLDLAKSGAAIFGAAAPLIFATDEAAQLQTVGYAPGTGALRKPGFDPVMLGLMALAAFAAWKAFK
jgi:hypothetical protein